MTPLAAGAPIRYRFEYPQQVQVIKMSLIRRWKFDTDADAGPGLPITTPSPRLAK